MRCKTSGSSPALDQKRRIVVAQIVALQADCCQEQPFCRCAGVPLMNGLRDALIDSPVKSVRACRSGPAVQPKRMLQAFLLFREKLARRFADFLTILAEGWSEPG